jgi:hypothetical protein
MTAPQVANSSRWLCCAGERKRTDLSCRLHQPSVEEDQRILKNTRHQAMDTFAAQCPLDMYVKDRNRLNRLTFR